MIGKFYLLAIISFYTAVSFLIFDNVFKTSSLVIDELFHIQQGLHYCRGNFNEWNAKITTFPGLYLLSAVLPSKWCNAFTLRLVPLASSILNVYLIYKIRSFVLHGDRRPTDVLLDTATLVILPPMYFFSHLYYTDIPSITTILLMLLFSLKKRHNYAAIFGAASVLMRQTNIVWVAGTLGAHIIDMMIHKIYPRIKLETTNLRHFFVALKNHIKQPKRIVTLISEAIRHFYGYILVVVGFITFLIINGSIVVGDKTAHEASLHIPQLFYFSLFFLIFGTSCWIPHLLKTYKIFTSKNMLITVGLLVGVITFIVKYNTLVHPYLLADNRHYTFYIWNRFYGRHELAKYIIIPAYVLGLMFICSSLDGSIGFKMFYFISTIMTLCLQRLVEVRYFLIPFLLLRLSRRSISRSWMSTEFLLNVAINVLTFYIFFTKEIHWNNFEDTQRLIW